MEIRMPDNDAMTRFIGGSPLTVAARLVLLSILVGVILAAIGLDPRDILRSIQDLFVRIWDMGFDAVRWLWRYFLLGAVLVLPIWFVVRLVKAPSERG
jgi:ABC-type amino acid transport system permease subunit